MRTDRHTDKLNTGRRVRVRLGLEISMCAVNMYKNCDKSIRMLHCPERNLQNPVGKRRTSTGSDAVQQKGRTLSGQYKDKLEINIGRFNNYMLTSTL